MAACLLLVRTRRVALFVSPAAPELHQLHVESVEHRPIQRADGVDQLRTETQMLAQNPDPGLQTANRDVRYLVGISVQVKVLQEAGGKLAEQEVVSLVDGPQTPVGVVVGAGAGTEGAH